MDTESTAPETKVPIKVPEPAEHAPPTLAEPASGPVAEMSGALAGGQTTETPAPAAPTVESSAPNGDTQPPAPTTESAAESVQKPSQPAASEPTPQANESAVSQDTEMKDTTETAPQQAGEPAVDDSALDAQKKGGNGKRKSSGVPEHKNKKLNKKKSMAKITHLDAQPGDYFFARLKSYPPWPSIICDEEILPTSLLSTRPVTTKKADGTYNEPYADGGKKVNDRTFPVMFLYTNEFAWIPNTDLGDLDPQVCKDAAEKGKAKALYAAYQVAAEAHDLPYFKTMLLEHAKAMEEDEAAKAEKEAEKVEKATKKKRKSEAKVEDLDVDMDDVDDTAEVKKSSKKRKKAAESDDEETEKTPKTTKLKLTTNKTPATTEKKSKDKPPKAKSEKRKSKAAVEDEEMEDAPEAEPEQPMDPEEARKAREREVLFLRHKLQKGFLSRDQAPQEEDMPQMSNYIKKLENYEDLEVAIIRTTKINKVLKALVKLNTIPKDEEFNFRKRSIELLSKWNKILGAEPQESEDKDSKETPTTNGVHDDTEKPAEESTEVPPVTTEAEAEIKPQEPAIAITTEKAEQPAAPTSEPVKPAEPAPTEEPKAPTMEGTAAPTVESATTEAS